MLAEPNVAAPAQPVPEEKPPVQAKLSPVEGIKESSRQLRGTLAQELAQPVDHFGDESKQLLKFHGSYQQDDRDARKVRTKERAGKLYNFMVRCKIPGGKVTAAQYLALDDLAGQHANGSLRITSRQGIQFHGILKTHLKETIAGINECLLSTLGACGDVERNVMAPPAPYVRHYAQLQALADRIAEHLAPRSRAYHEIWLDGEPLQPDAEADHEPIYGKVYLPRKFKTGLALPYDNSIDLYAQDLGFLAVIEKDQIVGYNVLVGGGMGMTHGNEHTFPYLAKPMCFVKPDQVVAAAEAVVKLFRDHGNRGDRKRARIKYVVHDWGVARFREVLATYLPFPLILPRAVEATVFPLHLGWHEQGDGKYFYGISVRNGRIQDADGHTLRTALRLLVQRLQPSIRLTPMQDILLCDLPANAKADIERTLGEHGVALPGRIPLVQQYSMACPAIPTCGLAISEAERVIPQLTDQIHAELERLGLGNEIVSVRMTGCPNGCVRPYQSDIGIVGRSGDKYTLFVGGNTIGDHLNFVLKDMVPLGQIVATLRPVLESYKAKRMDKESFGDYCRRLGQNSVQALLA